MGSKKLRVYVDTSVVGGCMDAEFTQPTRRLFTRLLSGDAVLVISDVTLAELQGAPEEVQEALNEIPLERMEFVMRTKSKSFDCVELMRELRDRLSRDMAAMSGEERIRYIRQKASGSPLLGRVVTDRNEPVQQASFRDEIKKNP